MVKIAHRINTISGLRNIGQEYGVEIDLRADGKRIVLNHETFLGGEDFGEYLQVYRQAFLVLNIKEAGIEKQVIEMVESRGITDYFLLDVEFPYIYRATHPAEARSATPVLPPAKIAVRYSEAEPIEQALALKGLVEWAWIDTNTTLPLDKKLAENLRGFKTCLVSPDRWGRPEDISKYKQKIGELDFQLDAVMVDAQYFDRW